MTIWAETRVANANKKIDKDMSIDLGGVVANIIMTPGHTASNISVFVPAEGVLFCGDCIVNGYLPNLDSGTVSDWQIWTESLEKIEQIAPQVVVPGHGLVIRGEDIRIQIRRVREILRRNLCAS